MLSCGPNLVVLEQHGVYPLFVYVLESRGLPRAKRSRLKSVLRDLR